MCLDYKNLWQALHDVSCILSFPSIISAPPKFRCPVILPRPSLNFLLVLTLDPPVRVHPPFWCGGLPETQTWHNTPLPPSPPNPGFEGPPQWCYSLPFQLSLITPTCTCGSPCSFLLPGWRTLHPPPTLLPLSSIPYLLLESLLKICYSLRPGFNLVPLKNPFKILWNSLPRHCVCISSVSGLALICLPSVRVIYKCLFLLLCCTF